MAGARFLERAEKLCELSLTADELASSVGLNHRSAFLIGFHRISAVHSLERRYDRPYSCNSLRRRG